MRSHPGKKAVIHPLSENVHTACPPLNKWEGNCVKEAPQTATSQLAQFLWEGVSTTLSFVPLYPSPGPGNPCPFRYCLPQDVADRWSDQQPSHPPSVNIVRWGETNERSVVGNSSSPANCESRTIKDCRMGESPLQSRLVLRTSLHLAWSALTWPRLRVIRVTAYPARPP